MRCSPTLTPRRGHASDHLIVRATELLAMERSGEMSS